MEIEDIDSMVEPPPEESMEAESVQRSEPTDERVINQMIPELTVTDHTSQTDQTGFVGFATSPTVLLDPGSESDDPLLGESDNEPLLTNNHTESTSAQEGRQDYLSFFRSARNRARDALLHMSVRSWPWHLSVSPRRRRRRRRCLKKKERNYGAAVCSMIAALCLLCAFLDINWISMRGGGCRDMSGAALHVLGVFPFVYSGVFEHPNIAPQGRSYQQFYRHDRWVLLDCVTPEIVEILRSIVALVILSFFMCIISLVLDVLGPTSRLLKFVRRNAVISILTVVICVSIIGFSFLVSQLLRSLQENTKEHHFNKVEIHFSTCFYLITAAGAISIVGCAFNLLRRYPHHRRGSSTRHDTAHDSLHPTPPSFDYSQFLSPMEDPDEEVRVASPYREPPPPYVV